MIYRELFHEDVKLVATLSEVGKHSVAFIDTGRSLLSTCKTVNNEARRLLEENTTLHIKQYLIRGSYGNSIPLGTSTAIESFTRKMKLDGAMSFCGFPQLNLSAYQQLRRLEFTMVSHACCVSKHLKVYPSAAGQATADILQRHWLDKAARGWGVVRRIEGVKVTVDPDSSFSYNFCITMRPARSASRHVGRINVSYAEDGGQTSDIVDK